MHQGRGFTGSGQYCAVKKGDKAGRTVHQGREVTGSGQYSAVKKIIVARHQDSASGTRVAMKDIILRQGNKAARPVHSARPGYLPGPARLQVQDSILPGPAMKHMALHCGETTCKETL